ncbi:MAG TPA: CPBP family intramembrane glutamic endopeptidase [Pyrinomonadaceae bacterium]
MTPLPPDSYSAFDAGLVVVPESSAAEPDPDNPPWGVATAMLVWAGSILLLVFIPSLIILPYILYGHSGARIETTGQLMNDPVAVLLSVLSTVPVHVLTLGLVWAVVTGLGKRPFWRTLGWSWSSNVGPWTSICAAVLVLVAGGVLTWWVGGEPTEIDLIVSSSTAARISLALLATLTAPLVEETVYRGLLYSAFQKVTGIAWAIVIVAFLFTLVHVYQYRHNLGVIAAISIFSLSLTFMRAYSGRLLPCYVMHLVFNGLQSLVIVFGPYIQRGGGGEQKTAIIHTLTQLARNLS